MRETKAARLSRLISEQRRWIEEHGDSLSGYIARYGRASGDPEKPVGEGGWGIKNHVIAARPALAQATQ